MKRHLPVLFITALVAIATQSYGQADMIIKQRAKDLRDANNARQGVPPPAAPVAAPTPAAKPATPPPPAAPQISPEQQQGIDKLTTDLAGIKAGSAVTTEQKQSLEKNLAALAKGGTKPSKEAVAKLSGDISSALSGKEIKERERGQLAKAINVVMNSGSMTTAQAQTFVTVAQSSLKSSGAGEAEVKAVTDDLRAIVAEIQKSRPKLYQ